MKKAKKDDLSSYDLIKSLEMINIVQESFSLEGQGLDQEALGELIEEAKNIFLRGKVSDFEFLDQKITNEKSVTKTPILIDVSGLKLDPKILSSNEDLNFVEAKNTLIAIFKYFLNSQSSNLVDIDYNFFLNLHFDMFGEVWTWAGKIRHIELNLGVKAYRIREELKMLEADIKYWQQNKTFSDIEIAARLHQRAVYIHPFANGNGRWARMLANIYLKQKGLKPTSWNGGSLAKDNQNRTGYIQAIKLANNGNYRQLIKLHKKLS